MGSEAKAQSGSGLLRGDRQPTSLLSDLSSEKAGPGTFWRNVETALCSIGKNATPLPPMGRWDPGMGFRTQAKVLMGLLEAANCGVSQGAELAGSRPNWREAEAAHRRLVGARSLPRPTLGPPLLPVRTQGPGHLAAWDPVWGLSCPPQIHMLPS